MSAKIGWALGLVLALVSCTGGSVAAQDVEDAMNRVSFQVESTREVENDWVTASLATTEEDVDAAVVADRINQTMRWALDTAKAVQGVEVRSGGYRTHPIHEKTRIVRWRGSQDLILESADVEKISKLIGELQTRLQVQSVRFSVSDKKRRAVQDELISEALEAFKSRAQLVRVNLDAPEYDIVSLAINTGGGGGRPEQRTYARAMSADVAPPAFESGTSTVSVNINATIELRL